MNIIRKQPSPSGAYPAPQSWNGATIPAGYAIVPDGLDMTDFYAHNGFVVLAIANGIVTGYAPNTEAWEAWKASLPPEPEPAADPNADRDTMIVDQEYRLTLLELGVTK